MKTLIAHKNKVVEFVVAHHAAPAFRVFFIDKFFDLSHDGMGFFYPVVALQIVILVYPIRYAGKTAGIVYGNAHRTVEQFFCIENVVYFFVLEHAVRVNARAGGIETPADERRSRRNNVTYFLFEIFRYVGYGGVIHSVLSTL